MKLSDRAPLARAIWQSFAELTHEPARNPTSKEWYLLSGWLDREIPLPVILQAFREFNGRPRLLTAMEGPVDREYARWRRAAGLGDERLVIPL